MGRKSNDAKEIEETCKELLKSNFVVTPKEFLELVAEASKPIEKGAYNWGNYYMSNTALINVLQKRSYFVKTGISKGGKHKGRAYLNLYGKRWYFPNKYLIACKI